MNLLKVFALVLFALPVCAQTAAPLPITHIQFSDVNGNPLAGGFVYTCVAGSSCPGTPQISYSNATGSVNQNPIVLNAGGFGDLWGSTSPYKIVVEDLNGVVQYTIDNIPTTAGAVAAALAGTNSASLLNYTATGSTFERTQAAKDEDIQSVKDWGAIGQGSSDDTYFIQLAINYCENRVPACAVYMPSGVYEIDTNGGLTVTRPPGQGFTLYGDGPHATQLIASITALTSGAVLNITANGFASVFRDFTVETHIGGNRNIDAIHTTGDGQFFSNLWLSNCGSGLHVVNGDYIYISHVNAELNNEGFNLDTTNGVVSLTDSGTYQNQDAGILLTGTTTISGTATLPANVIGNMIMQEDSLGGGNGAIQNYSNVPVVITGGSIASNNNGAPATGVFIGTGTTQTDISNVNFSHLSNYGVYAESGNVSITGGSMNNLGWYATVPVPGGTYSPTTQSAGVFAGAGVGSLRVTGVGMYQMAGDGVLSYSESVQINGNNIQNWGTGGSAGASRNPTTGLYAIRLFASATYFQGTVIGNIIAASTSGLTGVFYGTNGVTLPGQNFVGKNNIIQAATRFATNQTTAQLALQDIDLDGITSYFSTAIQTGGTVSASGYYAGATAGYSGTKTAGSCVMTFVGGIITSVTGC